MARQFLAPEEQRLLRTLPEPEAEVLRACFDLLDAHLVEDGGDVEWMRDVKPRELREVAA